MNRPSTAPASPGEQAQSLPAARRVPFDAPWLWLAAGWRDMWHVPQISLAFGLVAAIGAAVIALGLTKLDAVSLFLALAGGFLLIGPLLAVGLYETSRCLDRGEVPRLQHAVGAWRGARGQLLFFGAILLFVFLVWLQLAFLLLMLFLGGGGGLPPPSDFMHTLLFTSRGLGLLVVGSIAGGTLAAIVYAISAFAVPMLLLHEIDAVTAARASIAAGLANPKPMLLWAGLIAVIMAAGFATLLAGLIIAFPLIGHATWHAYADVFEAPEGERGAP